MKKNKKNNTSMRNEENLVALLGKVQKAVSANGLNEEFLAENRSLLEKLTARLQLSEVQVVLLAVMAERGGPCDVDDFADMLSCSNLEVLKYQSEFDGLVEMNWVLHISNSDFCYNLYSKVMPALLRDEVYVLDFGKCTTEEDFMCRLRDYCFDDLLKHSNVFDTARTSRLLDAFVAENQHIEFCKYVAGLEDVSERLLMLFAMAAFYAALTKDDPSLADTTIQCIYGDNFKMRNSVEKFQKEGFVVRKKEEYNNAIWQLGPKAVEKFFPQFVVKNKKSKTFTLNNSCVVLREHANIAKKELFYNAGEYAAIETMRRLLAPDGLTGVQQRLKEKGMRTGVCCLFYGAPGTGKTETVLQFARETGRNVFQVDISQIREKYVGQSEHNLKNIFNDYREVCRTSELTPIMLFNEADAMFSKRMAQAERSSDKSENTMKNILLQEMEDFEGVMIATTNLAGSLDEAFERRFLYKVKFERPEADVKAKILKSRFAHLSDKQLLELAAYDFSGGELENIERQCVSDYVLCNQETTFEKVKRAL